jgi:hypothetical protein
MPKQETGLQVESIGKPASVVCGIGRFCDDQIIVPAQYLYGVERLRLTTKPAVPLWWFGSVLIRAVMNNPRVAVLPLLWLACAPAAQAAPADVAVESVVVTAGALPGTALDPDKVPFNTQIINSADLKRFGAASTLDTLDLGVSGVSISNAQDNPFQPSLFYRGFEASPLAGDAQGLAVYANGVRLNQSFGDTLNWDLIPDVAIDRLTLEGSNPVFGLNALGGSIAIQTKNGFTYDRAEGEVLFGAFGREHGAFQYGVQSGSQALYIAATGLSESGWRQHSPSELAQLFADLGWRGRNGAPKQAEKVAESAAAGREETFVFSRSALTTIHIHHHDDIRQVVERVRPFRLRLCRPSRQRLSFFQRSLVPWNRIALRSGRRRVRRRLVRHRRMSRPTRPCTPVQFG